jgi:hypothetical protein
MVMKRYVLIDHEKACKATRFQRRTLVLASGNLRILAAECRLRNEAVQRLGVVSATVMILDGTICVLFVLS